MRIPDPKPMPLTPKCRLLRELATLRAMSKYLRTQAAPLPEQKPPEDLEELEEGEAPAPPPVELASDLPLCALFDMVIEQGEGLAEKADASIRSMRRAPPGTQDFMDLAYAVKADFFQELDETDAWYRA